MAMIRPETEMKDSGIKWVGLMPVNWKTVRIKNLPNQEENSFVDGDWIESSYITDSGIRYYTTGNIGDGKFKEQGNGYISENTFNELKCKYAFPGDLVLSRLNEPYGRSCIIPETEPKCIVAVDNVILRTHEDKRYICYITQCDGYHAEVGELARGTAMKRVSRTNLGTIRIPLPAKIEQQAIADYLDETCSKIDEIIAEAKASIDEYKELKQSVIFEAVTKGLDKNVEMKDSGIEWIGRIPKHWSLVKSNRFITSTQNGISRRDLEKSTGNIVLKLRNITEIGEIDYSYTNRIELSNKEFENYILQIGDLLFVRVNGSKALVGKCAIFNGNNEPVAYNDHIIRVQINKFCVGEYFKWYLLSQSGKTEIALHINTSAGQYTISGQGLKDIYVSLPPIHEQENIIMFLGNKCKQIDSLIAEKESLIADLEAYKKSLIYEVVTGKRRVV